MQTFSQELCTSQIQVWSITAVPMYVVIQVILLCRMCRAVCIPNLMCLAAAVNYSCYHETQCIYVYIYSHDIFG
jgi:hypothetical protein